MKAAAPIDRQYIHDRIILELSPRNVCAIFKSTSFELMNFMCVSFYSCLPSGSYQGDIGTEHAGSGIPSSLAFIIIDVAKAPPAESPVKDFFRRIASSNKYL